MLEYINKQQAIDLAESLRNIAGDTITNAFIKGIEGVEGWISVKDRLPTDSISVLVFLYGTIDIGWYSEVEECWDTEWVCDVEVTHWMPLPKPPKEKGQG